MISKNGLILSSTKYRDYDAIINVLFNDGYESILIRGAYRPNNKNFIFTNILIYANFEYYQGKVNGNKLKCAKVIESYNKLDASYENVVFLSFVNETLRKIVIESDYDKLLKLSISILRGLNKNKDIYMLSAYFLIKITHILGIELNLNTCVICGNKNEFKYLSFTSGGVVCDEHLDSSNDYIKLNRSELNILKTIYQQNDFVDFNQLDESLILQLILNLTSFLESNFSIKINSLSLLTKHL